MSVQAIPYQLGARLNLDAWVSTAFRQLRHWSERARQRHQLGMLDAHQLRDIGISREQALAEASKPFWE